MPIGEVEVMGMYCLSVGFVGAGANWVIGDPSIRGFTRVIIFSFVGIVSSMLTIISYLKSDMRSVYTFLIYAIFGLVFGASRDEHQHSGLIRQQGQAIMVYMLTLTFITIFFTAMFATHKKTPIENIVMEALFCLFCICMSIAGTIDALSMVPNLIMWFVTGIVSIILGLWGFYIGLAHDVYLHMGKDSLYIKRGGIRLKALENEAEGKAPAKSGDSKTKLVKKQKAEKQASSSTSSPSSSKDIERYVDTSVN